jgi:Right handed beta helix region
MHLVVIRILIALFCASSAYALTDVELQKFIDDAIKAGGGEVLIPPGVHTLSKPLQVKDAKKLRIVGYDAERSELMAAHAMVLSGTCDGVTIAKLTLDGGGIDVADGAKDVRIVRCVLKGKGIALASTESARVEECTLMDINGVAIAVRKSMAPLVAHNHITRAAVAMVFDQASDGVASANEVRDCAAGVVIEGVTTGQRLVDNAFVKIKGDAIRIASRGTEVVLAKNDFTSCGSDVKRPH